LAIGNWQLAVGSWQLARGRIGILFLGLSNFKIITIIKMKI